MTKLEEIQTICCLLLDEFAKICEQNNLQWFVDSGTLLGAIRHGGFIPWDDDIDIVMPRSDYNRLIELGHSVFKEPFFLQTYLTDNEYSYNAQLRYSNSTKIRKFELSNLFRPNGKRFSSNKGISIDICPLDNVPANDKENDVIAKTIKFCHHYCSQRLLTYQEYNKYLNMLDFIHAMVFINHTLTKIDEVNKDSGYIACTTWWGTNKYAGCKVHTTCYADYILMPFKGCKSKVRVPIGYDEILHAYYGDYMIEDKHASLHEIANTDVIFDIHHSYHEYEKLSNAKLLQLMQTNQTL